MKRTFRFFLVVMIFISNILISEAKVVTDLTGKKVDIPNDIQRIAVVPIPWTSLVFAVDGADSKIIGMHPSSKKAYEISILRELAPNLGKVNSTFVDNNFNINYEEASLLKPELMIVWDYQEDAIEQLKKVRIPTVAIKYGSLENVQNGIKLLGEILGKEEKAQKLIQYHKDTNKYLESKKGDLKSIKKQKILYLRDSQLTVATGKSVNNIMIEMAGGINVTKDIKTGAWSKVTMEQIMAWNPDIIILSNFDSILPNDIYNNKINGQNWKNISAVKNKKVFKAPIGIYRWDAPCAETPLMMKWIAQISAPKIFKDYNLRNDIKKFYKEFFNYQLSEEQLDKILNVKLNTTAGI